MLLAEHHSRFEDVKRTHFACSSRCQPPGMIPGPGRSGMGLLFDLCHSRFFGSVLFPSRHINEHTNPHPDSEFICPSRRFLFAFLALFVLPFALEALRLEHTNAPDLLLPHGLPLR